MNLQEMLDSRVRAAELYKALTGGAVKCLACAHGCAVKDGARGICRMRFNKGGALYAPWGYVAGQACDPVEKKPFFHLLPGSGALSFGMLGCNFYCEFCQNYVTSQALNETECVAAVRDVVPRDIVSAAARCGAKLAVSTYNEPLITAEWAKSVFTEAKAAGLLCAYVSNGYASPEAVEYIRPVLDAWKVDLKCFDDGKYRKTTGGSLKPVLDTIRRIKDAGIWTEIVTLVIPGFNDSHEELSKIAGFIASVSPDIPWHVTAFHPDYKMTGRPATPPELLDRAVSAGLSAGLKFVYSGNIPGSGHENTLCPSCGALLVERAGYEVKIRELKTERGHKAACAKCGAAIAGIF